MFYRGESFPVYSMMFSQFDSSLITTSGRNHINFWRVVQTVRKV
jgi:hypothetical protein